MIDIFPAGWCSTLRKLSACVPPKPCRILVWVTLTMIMYGVGGARDGDAAQLPPLSSQFATLPVDGWRFDAAQPIAYEDHQRFTYVVASVPPENRDEGSGKESRPLIRRFVLLKKPSTIVVDDLVPTGEIHVRQVHVLHTFATDVETEDAHAELTRDGSNLKLTIRSDDTVCKLDLPPADTLSGEIAIETAAGEVLLANRLLTSGVLPFGPEGTALLERWDSAYRSEDRAPWDIGRPSGELVKAVQAGTLAPCRAVVLGCGTGTNAIYLAQQGFDVTGIDIAPTALTRAKEKADRAGVKVRWVLADVTAPPTLIPFDLVYDRGCYHGVRRQNADGYVASLRQLTHPGAKVLILAGNANEDRHDGPPRVEESEIRGDFSQDFDFQWLNEIHFETLTAGEKGALAWSILLERKENNNPK